MFMLLDTLQIIKITLWKAVPFDYIIWGMVSKAGLEIFMTEVQKNSKILKIKYGLVQMYGYYVVNIMY